MNDEHCGRCNKCVPPESHSPLYCSTECESQWKSSMYGEQAPTPTTAFPDTQLSQDSYGWVRWSTLSWWPHPQFDRRPYDNREAS